MNIKNGANKVKNFVKDNWGGILIGAAVAGLGIAGGRYVVTKVRMRDVELLPIPKDWDLGKLGYFSKDPSGSVAVMVDIPMDELSRLGENVAKLNIDEKFDTVGALMTFVESTNSTKT